MYDAHFTIERIHEAEALFKAPIAPHTLDEIDEWTDRLSTVFDVETGEQVRRLDKDEHAFILNERRMSRLDFRYWGTSYWKIRDQHGIVRRWSPNIAQAMVLDVWGELEAGGHAIMMQQLKARQLGVSTLSEGTVCHRTQFYPDVNALIASSSPDQSEKMSKMIVLALDEQPWWLRPTQTRDKAGELIEFGGQNSGISIQAGNQIVGLGRGTTPDVVHLSELADYPDPEDLVDSSLMRAMHESPWLFMVLESTAKGRHNWWHKSWEWNVANWPIGRARLRPIFLPWFVGRDIYPTKTWLHTRPVPQDWIPNAITTKHAERAAAYVSKNALLKKYLGDNWTMPREQQWFYEVEREEAKAKKELNKFLAEMPADDHECFQSTNISAFDTEIIISTRENVKEPWGVFGIRGDQNQLPARMQPYEYEIDRSLKPIPVTAAWGTAVNRYELVPLKFEGFTAFDPHGKILIWEPPREDFTYGLGCDTGDGVGEDRTVLEGVRKGTHDHNDAQVFEYASPYVNAYNLWPIALCLATLYSPRLFGERKQCKAVIECRGNGEHVQLEMRKNGWANFHQWMRYDGKRLRLKDANKIGWFTNQWSRAAMLDMMMTALNDGWFEVYSPWFIDEMADLERSDFAQSLKAMYGGHDDRFMAAAMVLFSLHVMDFRKGETPAPKREREQYADEDYPVWSPGMQGDSGAGISGDMQAYMKFFGIPPNRRIDS